MVKKIHLDVLKELALRESGLTDAEVQSQRSKFGSNAIVERAGNAWLELLLDTAKDPMVWFLLGIGAAFFAAGEEREAFTVLLATLPLLLMDAFLHWRTQASVAGLKAQLETKALVIRGGQEARIDTFELVPGDLVRINPEHGFLPADGYWEGAESLQVDESVLTGEAFPIAKKCLPSPQRKGSGEIMADSASLGFAGTRALTGTGLLRVLVTGKNTAYGEIVQSVSAVTQDRSALQLSIAKLTRQLIYAAAGFCVVLAAVRYYQGHGWLDALLSAATLAVAAIPEEFPVVFAFFLGVGVYRLAKRHALVRRAVSVENIGRITFICTDKTGTITKGELRLTHVHAAADVPEAEALLFAGAASNPDGTDPVDLAILSAARERGLGLPLRERVIPFAEDRKRETSFFRREGRAFCAVKGSPETVLAMADLGSAERDSWLVKTANLAKEGHKVLAAAAREITEREAQAGAEPEKGWQFKALLAFEDPPRVEVGAAVEYCRRNGIHVLMITGDHPETAASIAREIGLQTGPGSVLSAEAEPEKLEEAWLRAHPDQVRNFAVIARCNPRQKLQVVSALKAAGEVVAVTGDGVNDVPALKAADIGIAMGLRGSRSAKEVASIILTDDNFSTIVAAVREGRQLFMNLRRSFEFLLLFHIPFVLSAALLPLLGYPLLYLPVHVVWLEMIIHPTALFAFQEAAAMGGGNEPAHEARLFTRRDTARIVIAGLAVTAVLVLAFVSGLAENSEVGHARSKVMALLSFYSAGLVLLLAGVKTKAALWIAAASVGSAVLLIQTSWLAGALHLSPLHLADWAKVGGAAGAAVVLLHFWKRWSRNSRA